MKSKILTLFACLTFASTAAGNPPKTEEELITKYQNALTSKDSLQIAAMIYQEGMSEQDRTMTAQSIQRIIANGSEIDEVALAPLPKGFRAVEIAHGKKVEMTGPPLGMLNVRYEDGAIFHESSRPYTIIDGTYYLVGPKSSDLGWDGPPDKQIGFVVRGTGQDSMKIEVSWNTSGVMQSSEFPEPSMTFWGQFIESITVTSESDDAEVTLSIHLAGETTYTSEPLRGQGRIEYQRNQPATQE